MADNIGPQFYSIYKKIVIDNGRLDFEDTEAPASENYEIDGTVPLKGEFKEHHSWGPLSIVGEDNGDRHKNYVTGTETTTAASIPETGTTAESGTDSATPETKPAGTENTAATDNGVVQNNTTHIVTSQNNTTQNVIVNNNTTKKIVTKKDVEAVIRKNDAAYVYFVMNVGYDAKQVNIMPGSQMKDKWKEEIPRHIGNGSRLRYVDDEDVSVEFITPVYGFAEYTNVFFGLTTQREYRNKCYGEFIVVNGTVFFTREYEDYYEYIGYRDSGGGW